MAYTVLTLWIPAVIKKTHVTAIDPDQIVQAWCLTRQFNCNIILVFDLTDLVMLKKQAYSNYIKVMSKY